MSIKNRLSALSFVLVFILILSAVLATPVYADEAPPEDVTTEEQVEETEAQPPVEEEASPPSTGEPDSAPSEESIPDEEQPILEQLPENTEIIVLDEEGQALPLVTQEAEEAIAVIDPLWCPVGVKPKANTGGCTAGYPNLYALINDIATDVIPEPTKAGVIWIQTGSDASPFNIVIDGSDPQFTTGLNSWANFALTLQGGWIGTDLNTTITSPSTFSDTISIINWNAPVTINDITIDTTTGVGLTVNTTGNIVLKNVQSNNNNNSGAEIDNTAGTGNVTITNSKFINNNTNGLSVDTNGTITIKDITANDNSGYGVSLDNDDLAPKAVTLSGTNTFNANGITGLYVTSRGAITINNLSASNNSNNGAELNNNVGASTAGVTLTGTNIFSDNSSYGLYVESFGVIKINNLFANSNSGIGAYLDNSLVSVGAPAVTLTGTNEFKYNTTNGLSIVSKGLITINNISANNNGNVGTILNNVTGTGTGITLTGTNSFNENFYTGLSIISTGVVSLNNITANDNGASNTTGYGVSISNQTLGLFKGVTLTGTNSISFNKETNLYIVSSGAVTLNNITANYSNIGYGISITNTASGPAKPMAVTINGTNNTIRFNDTTGLAIDTHGAVTLNNITADHNGQSGASGDGVYVNNSGSNTAQNVTIKGNNNFNHNYESGLFIVSKGIITTNNVNAFGNDNYGAYLLNTASTTASGVTMTGTNDISSNDSTNLYILSNGTITLNNISADYSATGSGATIINTSAATAKNVVINGTNSFSFNSTSSGLYIGSIGTITVNNMTASNNGSIGAMLDNSTSSTKAGVTINGINDFSANSNTGLYIYTLGNVKTNSVSAYSNGLYGVEINGNISPNTGSVTMTGNNNFYGNASDNLYINVYGTVTLNNIYSTNSLAGNGAYINNTYAGNTAPKTVTLTGTNTFSINNQSGLEINTFGIVSTNNITATNNDNAYGVDINNSGTATGKAANVTMNGTNYFENNDDHNLYIVSDGLIKINNVTSIISSTGYGAYLHNNTAGGIGGVTVSGTNLFEGNNFSGLYIESKGAVSLNNISALSNGGNGVSVINTASTSATPKPVTLTGTNVFDYNQFIGLEVDTYGAITTNNISANNNGQSLSYGSGVDLNNAPGANTIVANITMNGNNNFNYNYDEGLFINAYGAVKINNLTAISNSNHGAEISTTLAPSNAYGITLTGKVLVENNNNRGLNLSSKGAVLINNLTAYYNGTDGLYVDNTSAGASTPKPVTLTGINITSNNTGYGFNILSYGVVTLNKITANYNASGSKIENQSATNPANVVIAGYGVFQNNPTTGLSINSKGAVTLTNINASNNNAIGLFINNTFGTGTSAITLSGINIFNNNNGNGAHFMSNGAISITKITADYNSGNGVLATPGSLSIFTITCGSFIGNAQYGWDLTAGAQAIIKGVFAAGNSFGSYTSVPPVVFSRACPLP